MRRILPGFHLSLGWTFAWLAGLVMVPLSTVFVAVSRLSFAEFRDAVTSDRAVAAFQLSFGSSLVAAALVTVAGLVVAWALVRYEFPGRRLLDACIDLPFALPTAVAGIALTATWSPRGPLGKLAAEVGIRTAYSEIGIVLALMFVGLPFVVRSVQPVLETLDERMEEAAATLGATRWQTIVRVVLPTLRPALLTGYALAFARAVGEYGSVVFIAGNLPMRTEIAPLLIMSRLEQFDYAGAASLALVMLVLSLGLLVTINAVQLGRGARAGRDG